MSFLSNIRKPVLKIDKYLLENYPLLWEVKLHWVLYFVLCSHVIVAALLLLLNVTASNKDNVGLMYGLSFIPITLAIGAWVPIVVRFNILKENGNASKSMELPKFFAIMLSLALIFSTSFTIPTLLCYNSLRSADLENLRSEIDILNEGNPYFIDNTNFIYDYSRSPQDTCIKDNFYLEYFFKYFEKKQSEFLKIKDEDQLRLSYENIEEKGVKEKIRKFLQVSESYGNIIEYSVDSIYALHERKCSLFTKTPSGIQYMGPQISGYNSYEVYSAISEEVDIITFDFWFFDNGALFVYFIFILCLALLINILKSFRWQSVILLPIVFIPFIIISVVILLLIAPGRSEEELVMTYFFLVYILLVIKGIRGAYKSHYSWFSAISLMMAQLGLTALPLFILFYCSALKIYIPGLRVDESWYYYHMNDDAPYYYFWLGFLLLIASLSYFRSLHIRYNSLPRAK